ncbi:MAG: hypothetical protein JJE16_14295 [Nitrospiraceae bacterium]|nr:hypothetical protein [Nitrospiraceae bacterium]
MRNRIWTIQAACVLGLGVLSGCASLLPPSPLAPVLLADPADVTLIEALAHEQYTRVESCQARTSCPQDQYTRGLIALFQSRERAVASFQQVRSGAPNSRIATMSTSWIDLLQASGSGLSFLNVQSPGVPKVTEDFVWEALERELDGANETVRGLFSERAKRVGELTDRRPAISRGQAMSPKDTDQATVQALHKRLHERDRTLAERDQQIHVLSSQLDALKRIEEDTQDRRRPRRSSVLVAP